jgi:hypothetical protein
LAISPFCIILEVEIKIPLLTSRFASGNYILSYFLFSVKEIIMDEKFDNRPLNEIAEDMLNWCVARGCEKLGETLKEYRVQCPNVNCPSRGKGESHKAFDINRDTAQYHCFHCGLSGQGLHGERGLIAQVESEDFFPSANIGRISNEPSNLFKLEIKPKEKVELVMSREEVGRARAKGICEEAEAYLKRRGIPETVYRDFDCLIFSYPKGKQLSFMKQPLNNTAIFFPVFNDKKEVIHVSYKLLHGNYYNSPGPKPIYLTKGTPSSIIVVVEGIFDALSVYTVGYRSAALLGHEITSNHDLSVFQDKSVVVMLDNDVEKSKIYAIAKTLVGVAKDVKVATIPKEIDGHKVKDPNDVLVKVGSEKLSELIREAKVCDIEALSMEITESDDEKLRGKIFPIFPLIDTMDTTIEVKPSMVSMVEEKPKKESVNGFVFPQEAWRGIFATYRQAQEGTTEAPDQYHFAVLKTVAGIVVGRTAYVWNGRKLFPNFYSVLIGPTTKSRKSTAASRGTSLLSDVDETGEVFGADPLVLILRGLSTPAGLLAQLRGQNEKEGLSGIEYDRAMSISPCEGYRAIIVINEFASLLRQAKKEHGSGLIQLLNDAYDCLPELHNPTKIDPTAAKNTAVAMICLSTREWLENTLDVADVYGGYVCRNLFYEWTQTEPISDPDETNRALLNEVTMKLQRIRQAYEERGKCQVKYQFSTEAKPILKDWYDERYYRESPSEMIASATQRIDENVRKLALLYAVLENEFDDLTIHADQLQAAITVGGYWEQTATRLFGKFGFTKEARNEQRIIEVLEQKEYTKRDLQQHFGSSMSAKEFNDTIDALLKSDRIYWKVDKTNKRQKLLTAN